MAESSGGYSREEDVSRIALVYFSNTDITGELAKACITQAETSGAQVHIHQIVGREIVEGRFDHHRLFKALLDCDAIIFASPTYMGGVAAQFKAFADASSEYWAEQQWAGKVAAGITSGTALNGDQTCTLQYFSTLAAQHGMYWIGLDLAAGYGDQGLNRLGCQLGVAAEAANGVNSIDLETVRYLGSRVAGVVADLKGKM